MPDKNKFNEVFHRLKAIFKPYAKKMVVVQDTPSCYYLDTRYIMKNKKPLCFGAVRCDLNHVFAATEGLWFQIANGKLMVPNLPRLLAKECAQPHAISIGPQPSPSPPQDTRCHSGYLAGGPMSRLVPFSFKATPLNLNLYFRQADASNLHFRQSDGSNLRCRQI